MRRFGEITSCKRPVGIPVNTFASRLIFLAFPVVFVCSCAAVDVPPNPEAVARMQALKSVAVLPADVRLARTSIGGGEEQLRDLDMQAAGQLGALVAQEFSRRGFQAKEIPTAGNVTAEIQSAYDLVAYEQKYEIEHPTLVASGNLAGPAAAIAKQTGAEGIVFVKLEGYERSGGSVAAEMAVKVLIAAGGVIIPKNPNGVAVLGVALVDSKSGGVLWSHAASTTWGLSFPDFGQSDLADLVTKVFEKFPPKAD